MASTDSRLVRLSDKAYKLAAEIMKVMPDTSAVPGDMEINWTKFTGLVSELVDTRNEMRDVHNSHVNDELAEQTYPTFGAALEALLSRCDDFSGAPESGDMRAVLTLFRTLDRPEQKHIAEDISKRMVEALDNDEIAKARALMDVNRELREVLVRRGSCKMS